MVESDEEEGPLAPAKLMDCMETQVYLPDTQMVMDPLALEEALVLEEVCKPKSLEIPPAPEKNSSPSLDGPNGEKTGISTKPSFRVEISPEKEVRCSMQKMLDF